MMHPDVSNAFLQKGKKSSAVLWFASLLFCLPLLLAACCPPYCGEGYGSNYYSEIKITTIPKDGGYVALLNGTDFDNLELAVEPSEFATACSGLLEVTQNYAQLIKQAPEDFMVIMRKNCSLTIVRAH